MKQLRACCWFLVLTGAGCGYTTRGLYPEDIQTVAVPIFSSTLLTREIEYEITQKVIQTIESQTAYKVVPTDQAQTVLRGTVSAVNKSSIGVDEFNSPRGGIMLVSVTVSWIDLRSDTLIHEATYKIDQTIQAAASKPFVIDLAQSRTTALSEATEQIARHVVNLMQSPW